MTFGSDKKLSGFFLFAIVAWPFYLNDFYLIPLTGFWNRASPVLYTEARDYTNLLWVLDLVFYCAVPSITLWLLYKKGYLQHVAAALKVPPRLWLHVVLGLALAFATHVVFTLHFDGWCLAHGTGRLCAGYPLPFVGGFFRYVMIFYAAVTAGFLEEIIFRAHLMALLKRRLNSDIAVVIVSSILFAAMHWCGGTGKLLATFLISLIPAIIYLRTKNLWALIVWHSAHDMMIF